MSMALYTAAEILAKIEALDTKIDKAESAQSWGGAQTNMSRGDLKAMYAERERWIKEYDKAAANAAGGLVNKVKFGRPL